VTTPLEQTHLFREIHEQPDVVARLFSTQRAQLARLADAIRTRQITHVVIAARGTSDNAARYAQYVLGVRNSLLVALAAPSVFTIYGASPRLDRALVIGISQSGTSPDIVAVLAGARRQRALTAVFTNDPSSDLAGQGEFVIDLCAGTEQAVAATKTYTAELAAIALLSALLAGDAEGERDLQRVPAALRDVLAMRAAVAAVADSCREMERSVVIGRGFNYATAFEVALKMKELTYTIVEPYSSADFLHGPIAMIEREFPAIVLAPSGRLFDEMASLMQTLAAREAEVIGVSDRSEALGAARVRLRVPVTVPEWLSPLTFIVPGQLLAMTLARARGFDLDTPRAIRKVTRTI
jgi:glucosamine--fructose-6-phosphate aminotransferase (isomerizing)